MPIANAIFPVGDEPNQQVQVRHFTPQELEIMRVITEPANFNLTIEDKRQKTHWKNNRGPIGKVTFTRIMRDPWFIQQFRDTILYQMGDRLPEVLEACLENAKKPNGHSDRKMLLQILGIHRDVKEQRVSGNVDHQVDFSDRLEKSLKRIMQAPAPALPAEIIDVSPMADGDRELDDVTPNGVELDSKTEPNGVQVTAPPSDIEAEAEVI